MERDQPTSCADDRQECPKEGSTNVAPSVRKDAETTTEKALDGEGFQVSL